MSRPASHSVAAPAVDAAVFLLMQLQAMAGSGGSSCGADGRAGGSGPRCPGTLARYPFPIVRVACRYCKRRGQYRLETLVKAYGAQAGLHQVLLWLSVDCGLAANRTGRPGCLGPFFVDLEKKRR